MGVAVNVRPWVAVAAKAGVGVPGVREASVAVAWRNGVGVGLKDRATVGTGVFNSPSTVAI